MSCPPSAFPYTPSENSFLAFLCKVHDRPDTAPVHARGKTAVTDDADFVALFREHYNAVRRFIERRVSDREAADDLTMECFEIAWRKRDPREPFGLPWLYRTARNLIANEYRRRDREGALWTHIEDQVRTLSNASEGEMIDRLVDAIRALSEKEREILWLTYWEDLSAAEVGVVVGASAGTVWTRLNRVRAKLRPLLSDGPLSAEEVLDERR
jgi:RNA polymerase sigma-70 factor (ECF subfamily)